MLKKVILISLLLFNHWLAAQEHSQLIQAVKDNDLSKLRILLDSGENVNESEPDGSRALHWASHNNNFDMTQLIISAGADVNAKNRYGDGLLWSIGK